MSEDIEVADRLPAVCVTQRQSVADPTRKLSDGELTTPKSMMARHNRET